MRPNFCLPHAVFCLSILLFYIITSRVVAYKHCYDCQFLCSQLYFTWSIHEELSWQKSAIFECCSLAANETYICLNVCSSHSMHKFPTRSLIVGGFPVVIVGFLIGITLSKCFSTCPPVNSHWATCIQYSLPLEELTVVSIETSAVIIQSECWFAWSVQLQRCIMNYIDILGRKAQRSHSNDNLMMAV